MGYLDNSTIVVDAVLTKEGRQRLSQGNGLNITHFTLSDSGVDYRLWNPDHPSGSAYYGEAIENLPSLEAIPRGEFYMRNKLITLGPNVTGLPYWKINGSVDYEEISINESTSGAGTNSNGEVVHLDVLFDLQQLTPGATMVVVSNQSALGDTPMVAGTGGSFTITNTTTPDGMSYQSLVNVQSADASYHTFTPNTGPNDNTFYLRFNRPLGDGGVIEADCTIIDIATGVYRTFKLVVTPLNSSGGN